MGGYGSGRPGKRPVAETSLALKIGRFQRELAALVEQQQADRWIGVHGRVVWASRGYYVGSAGYALYCRGASGDLMLILLYKISGQEIQDPIRIEVTPCNFGGRRYWFICRCGARVGVLYAPGVYWRCRHCYNITYQSSNDSDPRVSRLLRDPAAFFAMTRRDDGDPIATYKQSTAELIVLLKAYDKLGRL